MPYNSQKCTYRGGGGKGAGCNLHPGCRAGIPVLTACAGGWKHRDPRGMLLCMHEDGEPSGKFGGVGGWGGAPRLSTQQDHRKQVCFPTYVQHASALHPLSLPSPYLVLDLAFFYTFSQSNID
jgi:hypothetical protein